MINEIFAFAFRRNIVLSKTARRFQFCLLSDQSSFVQDKKAFAEILKVISKIQKTSGSNYVVLRDK